MERIDKIVSTKMCISRTDARRLIKIGQVLLNGQRIKSTNAKADETDEITVNGEKITYNKYVYIMMNKPSGVVCDDKDSAPYAPTILDDTLKQKDLFCVGRLDKDTTGLLIITNDGEFSHKVISPKKHIQKRYRATLESPITDENIAKAKSGLTLKDGTKLLPAEIEIISDDRKTVDFVISEGKYHQIKRMAGAMDNKILTLNRISIGKLTLDDSLEIGKARILSNNELENIFL